MSNINVIILAGQGESTNIVYNGIKDSFSIMKVVIEEPVSKKQLLKRRIKKIGFFTVLGQIIFMIYNNIWLKNSSLHRINEIKNNKNLNDEDIEEKIVLRVDSIK